MAAPVIKNSDINNIMFTVKRNTERKLKSIMVNTFIPNFEYRNAKNNVVKPNTTLEI